MMLLPKITAASLLCLLLGGCASIVSGDSQRVSVTVTCNGHIHPTQCFAANERGLWYFQTPQTRHILRDSSALQIVCDSSIGKFGLRQPALFNPVSAGNYFIGGLLGTAVDLSRDTFWTYPAHISMESAVCKRARSGHTP